VSLRRKVVARVNSGDVISAAFGRRGVTVRVGDSSVLAAAYAKSAQVSSDAVEILHQQTGESATAAEQSNQQSASSANQVALDKQAVESARSEVSDNLSAVASAKQSVDSSEDTVASNLLASQQAKVDAESARDITVTAKGEALSASSSSQASAGESLSHKNDAAASLASMQKGVAGGVAPLGGDNKVPSQHLPSFVDDVLEFPNLAGLPVTGEAGKIYVTLDDNHSHRWTGSAFVDVTAANALSGAEIKALYESEPNTNSFTDNSKAKVDKSIDVAGLAACGLLTAHGLMKEPCAAKDFDCPATVANQFTIKANRYRVGNSLIDVPDTVVTLPAAPNATALLTRRDVVYLREDGSIGVFEGLGDSSDMATAGFAAVAGESDLWQDGTGFAVAVAYVRRRNQGAYHEYFNESGCRTWYDSSATQGNWYKAPFATGVLDTAQCMVIAFAGNAIIGARNSAGFIGGVSGSGRPDDKLYDAIYLSDITDPRAQATAPKPYQTDMYFFEKAVAGALKNFVTEGIPKLVPKERGVVEALANSTTDGGLVSVGDSSLYEVGSFVEVITEAGRYVTAGYVAEQVTATILRLRTTFAAAIGNLAEKLQPIDRTNGDTYIVQKVEYTTAQGADNTWTDIIGDPANYPRQATGVIDWISDQGSQTVAAGEAIEAIAGNLSGGTVGNIYLRVAVGGVIDLSTANYANTALYLDLGPKATFLANAQGMEGFPLLYGENGEDLIPDGTSKEFKATRPCSVYIQSVTSDDKGGSWGLSTTGTRKDGFEGSGNSWVADPPATRLELTVYKTPAHIFTDSNNLPVLGAKLGDVVGLNDASDVYGGVQLASDLIGKVPTKNLGGLGNGIPPVYPLTRYSIDPRNGELYSADALTHDTINLVGTSPAAKALPYLSDEAKPQLVVAAKEMIYDSGADAPVDFPLVDGDIAVSYMAGTAYRVRSGAGIVVVTSAVTGSFTYTDYTQYPDGDVRNSSGVLYWTKWNGSGWGDDNEFNVVNNTSTATDNNKNTVLVSTKSTKLPIRMPS